MFNLIFAVDVSGSMQYQIGHVTAALNKLIEEQRVIQGLPCRLGVLEFSNEVTTVRMLAPITEAVLTLPPFNVGGGTALLDAIGAASDLLHCEDGDRGMVVVLTDGEENASQHWSHDLAAAAIAKHNLAGRDFVYAVFSPQEQTRAACIQHASRLGFGMVYGCQTGWDQQWSGPTWERCGQDIETSFWSTIADIGALVTKARSRPQAINYAVELAKTGYTMEMTCGKFKARLMRAPRLTGDAAHSLPPGAPVPVFPVDALPGCPPHWTGGEGSYVCPVEPEQGLWFSFLGNDWLNTAVLVSTKGMNPITGRKIDGLKLEQRGEECPVHGSRLMAGGMCKECGYVLPPKNYIAQPDEPWLDGFRQADGTVRQFYFTADEIRDVASKVIGKANVVPAFGFAFFETKKRRAPVEREEKTCGGIYYGAVGLMGVSGHGGGAGGQCVGGSYPVAMNSPLDPLGIHPDDQAMYDASLVPGQSSNFASLAVDDKHVTKDSAHPANVAMPPPTHDFSQLPPSQQQQIMQVQTSKMSSQYPLGVSNALTAEEHAAQAAKRRCGSIARAARVDVSVGAGAQITQALHEDELGVEDWKDKPSKILRLYFVFAEEFADILRRGGIRDLKGKKAGYLEGLPVG